MTKAEWQNDPPALGMLLDGRLDDVDWRGRRVCDDDFFVVFNPSDRALRFACPPPPAGGSWESAWATAEDVELKGAQLSVPEECLCVLHQNVCAEEQGPGAFAV